MKFTQPAADIFVPDATISPDAALARATHLCIAAHQDDIEIMAYHGIAACFGQADKWFAGVVVTNGAGSPRHGVYEEFSDAQMQRVRRHEQRKAAFIGDYSLQIQLAHPSRAAKTPGHPGVQADLGTIFSIARPEVIYLHQPADKHDTHVAVFAHALAALRRLPVERQPRRVLGCEVWRDLDWVCDADKLPLDVGAYPNLAASLVGVFDSQISGGKRYDLATTGRRAAHATFHAAHATDRMAGITWAIDLTPLVVDPTLPIAGFIAAHIERLRDDVVRRVRAFS